MNFLFFNRNLVKLATIPSEKVSLLVLQLSREVLEKRLYFVHIIFSNTGVEKVEMNFY